MPDEADAHLRLLGEAVERRASDLHVDPLIDGYQIHLRVDGLLRPHRSLARRDGERLVNQFKAASGIETGTVFTPLGVRRKFRVVDRDIDCRLTLAPCISGPKLALRLLDPERVRHRIEGLGLHETGLDRFRDWLTTLNGMFLVSGPTASGKTTTLYALLHEMAEENRHVVTIEDPVEYEIDGINQIQVDPRHGVDFAAGVRTILRLDPDLAMVGEMREPEAARAAIGAAVAGHVILATIHARDAVSSVTALRNFGLADHQIASALGVVVNQRLVRRLCPECRGEGEFSPAEVEWLTAKGWEIPERAWRASPDGCGRCSRSGYFGRIGLFEVWNTDEGDYELLLAGADEETLRDRLERTGHTTLWRDAAEKIGRGITSFAEVRRLGLALPWD
ncbi:MAG: Flp pilus assembly complex ATPase component TadA [Verrucomicrobiae bacterium]|nr:Flp pilus assembly complex ATPase component TadA [Verrucomicrobiae bacterium]